MAPNPVARIAFQEMLLEQLSRIRLTYQTVQASLTSSSARESIGLAAYGVEATLISLTGEIGGVRKSGVVPAVLTPC